MSEVDADNVGLPPPEAGTAPDLTPIYRATAVAILKATGERANEPWCDLDNKEWLDAPPDLQTALLQAGKAAAATILKALSAGGYKIVPPGAVQRPRSDEEAAAMMTSVRQYAMEKKRKHSLVGGASGLILPPGLRRH